MRGSRVKGQGSRIIIIALFLSASSLCFALTSEEADFMFAKKAFIDGFYGLAQENLENFLNSYPETGPISHEARLLLGRCFYYQNNLKKASYEFETILNAAPAAAAQDSASYWLGNIHYRSGDFKSALEYYQKIIDEYPASGYSSFALYSKAWAYYKLGFLEDAASLFGDVISRYPLEKTAIDSFFKIGEIYYLTDDFENAKISLNNFIDKYPLSEKTAESYYLLGDINFKQKRYADSISFYKRALSISSGAGWAELASFRTAQDFFNTGDYDESMKRFLSCARQSTNPMIKAGSMLGLIYNYDKKGMTEEALKACDTLVAKFPKADAAAEGWYMKARILYDNNRLAQAEETCLKSMDKFSSGKLTGKIHYILGWTYLKENKIKDALTEFKAASGNLGDDIFAQSALCKIGDIYLDGGEYDPASKNFDRALKKYPDGPQSDYAQYRLGDIFLAAKKYSLAILAYQSLLVNFPQTGLKEKAMFKLAVSYFKSGSFREAMAEFEKLAKLSPRWADGAFYRFYLASSLYNLNRYEEALEIFRSLARSSGNDDITLRAQYQTGWCYRNMGRDMEAADAFGAFSEKYPDSKFSQDASSQHASILLTAAQNFEKWKMPDDAARVYKRLEQLKSK